MEMRKWSLEAVRCEAPIGKGQRERSERNWNEESVLEGRPEGTGRKGPKEIIIFGKCIILFPAKSILSFGHPSVESQYPTA